MSFAADPMRAVLCARMRRPCPWCERQLRPCNLSRHIAAQHHAQLTIYDELSRETAKAPR